MSVIENITALHSIVQLAINVQNYYKCSICLESINDGVKIDCKHTFCLECLKEHEKINSKNNKALCPICKKTIKRRKRYSDSYMTALITFTDELNTKLQTVLDTGIMALGSLDLIQKAVQKQKILEPPELDKNKLFDSLLQKPHPSVRKVYKAPKKSKRNMSKYEKLDILPFENEENKNYVLQWLNDNKNMFDRVTQTQNDVQCSEKSIDTDIESVSQSDVKKLSCRSRSLECLNEARPNPVSRSQSFEKIEEYSSDDNFIIPNAQEKLAIVNLLEDAFLQTVEKEVVKETNNNSKKKNTSSLLSGWQRMKEMKRMVRKHDRQPKKLNISRRQSLSSSETKNICKELKVMLTDMCDKKNDNKIICKKNEDEKLNDHELSSSSSDFRVKKIAKNKNKHFNLSDETSSSISCTPKVELVVAQVHERSEKKIKNPEANESTNKNKSFKKRTRSQIKEKNKIVVDVNSMEDYFKKNMPLISKDGDDIDALSQNRDSVCVVSDKISPNAGEFTSNIKRTKNLKSVQNSNKVEILNIANSKNDDALESDDDDDEIFSKQTQRINDKNDSETSGFPKVLATNDLLDIRIKNFENFIMCHSSHWENQDKIVNAMKKLKKLLLQNSDNDSGSEIVLVTTDQAIQTEINTSPRGIRVSSNEIFVTIKRNDVDVQTDSFSCPNCKNIIEHQANTNNVIEKILPNQFLTDSFDNMQFETQNFIKKSENSQNKVISIAEVSKNVDNTQSTSKTKDTTALIVDTGSLNKSDRRISRQLNFSEDSKPNYKRIRTISDSESDSEKPYDVKRICSKYLRNELQVSLHFETETIQDENKNQDLPKQPCSKTESQEMYEKCMKALLNAEKHSVTNKELPKTSNNKDKETVFSLNVMQEFQNEKGAFTCEEINEDPFKSASLNPINKVINKNDEIVEGLDESIFADTSFDEMVKKGISQTSKINNSKPNSELTGSHTFSEKKRKLSVLEENDKNISVSNKFLMDGVKPLSPKVNILQNVIVRDSSDGEKENIDKSLESDDIIEATPEKKCTSFRRIDVQNKENITHIDDEDNQNDNCLNITLPPPEEFQDDVFNENKIIALTDTDMDITICNKIDPVVQTSSQVLSDKIASIHFSQMLSPIAQEKKRQVLSLQMTNKTEFSPLTIITKTPYSQRNCPLNTSTPRQKSILNYTKPSENKKPCVACTRLSKDQIMAILSLNKKKLLDYSTNFGPSVTHMIVNSNDDTNRVKDHTIKFVLAVASGIWVLNFKWVQDCLQQNRIVPEEQYEVLDVSGVPGPKESRLNRSKKKLFNDFKIFASPPFQCTTKSDLEAVITLLDGTTVQNVEDFRNKNGKICLVVTEARSTQDFDVYERWLEKFGVITVDVEWVSRSVGQYKLLSLRPFMLCSDEINELNYPSELLVEVPFSFSQSTYTTA